MEKVVVEDGGAQQWDRIMWMTRDAQARPGLTRLIFRLQGKLPNNDN